MTRIVAVCFDLDGTLCENDQSGAALYRAAFTHAGIEPFGEATELWAELEGPPPTEPDAAREHLAGGFETLARRYGRQVDAAALAEGLLDTVDHSAVSLLPGAERALALARDHGPVGLLTNGPERRQGVKLESLELTEAFDSVVFAGDMRNRKPHPDPFDRVVRELGVDHAAVLYVGDSLEYDVTGARNAGLPVAWFRGDREAPDPDPAPDFVLDTYDAFETVLS
ncbi:HAD family hydrolase [Natronomonas sp. EA1]|uniref:HAD family hydrolase n=1 Tax=Natronomonas sp. EA1 TaxID=3421655 RepID=UPI003EB8D7E0